VTAREQCDIFRPRATVPGRTRYYGSAYFPTMMPRRSGARSARSIPLREKSSGMEASVAHMVGSALDAGGLVFTGDAEGNFIALDARPASALALPSRGVVVFVADG